jgi:prepilin-type N-terminal cleavage/methylation domain-containing protein
MLRACKQDQAGVTLIELMIAITLVAAISTGMLMAMRTSLITLEKVDARLQSNRRVMGAEQILSRQIGGAMPVLGDCPNSNGALGRFPVFNGTAQTLHLVSTYSLAEGARGYPHVLEFQVIPAGGGGWRLIVNEYLYGGPASTVPFCLNGAFLPVQAKPDSFVLADRLAFCRFLYRQRVPDAPRAGAWVPVWSDISLPAAVRIEMEPLVPDPAQLPLVNVTVPIHITREVGSPYADTL